MTRRAAPPEISAGIEGVQIVPLWRFADDRGAVFHMLKATDPHFRDFGEIYFSTVYQGHVKAWKKHRSLTANFACIHGRIRMVLYDARDRSPTFHYLMQLILGPSSYNLVIVPPGVWNGFQGLSRPLAIVANCATEPYDPDEFERADPHDPRIPFRWDCRSR